MRGRVLATPCICLSCFEERGRGVGERGFCSPRYRQQQSVSCACGARVTSPLLVQRRSNQEETTPRWHALRPSMGSGCAGGLRGFPTAHPCAGGKLARIPASHPADFCNDPALPAQIRPLKHKPRRVSSCRAPGAGVGGCKTRSSRRSRDWRVAGFRSGGDGRIAP